MSNKMKKKTRSYEVAYFGASVFLIVLASLILGIMNSMDTEIQSLKEAQAAAHQETFNLIRSINDLKGAEEDCEEYAGILGYTDPWVEVSNPPEIRALCHYQIPRSYSDSDLMFSIRRYLEEVEYGVSDD